MSENPTKQWFELIKEIINKNQVIIHEDSESYLVFMLMRFMQNNSFPESIIATEYLESIQTIGANQRLVKLRDVGDKCLLISGLFPEQAESRQVNLKYFVKIGRTAYDEISLLKSAGISELFTQLSKEFMPLMQILHCLRRQQHDIKYNILKPIDAFELWQETKSDYALANLQESLNLDDHNLYNLYNNNQKH